MPTRSLKHPDCFAREVAKALADVLDITLRSIAMAGVHGRHGLAGLLEKVSEAAAGPCKGLINLLAVTSPPLASGECSSRDGRLLPGIWIALAVGDVRVHRTGSCKPVVDDAGVAWVRVAWRR